MGSDSRPESPQSNNTNHFVLKKGKSVEVTSEEERFRGAWYSATIVESPPKSAAKKRGKVLVEYKTLIKGDSSPLVEPVDPAFIRPLPPDDSSRVFLENDVVDAAYKDGWWTGVLKKVLQGSKYRVYFDNPPDVMDFRGDNLRSHWDWVDGNWVSPEKQQTKGGIFSSGTEVEVNFEIENARDAWFPAVVIKENEDSTFLVKCQNLGNNGEAKTKATVDSCSIRPVPPRYVDRNYGLLERVDVPYNHGWRPAIITKLLPGKKYRVFFKQGNQEMEFNHSEIRPHAQWVDGRWVSKSKVLVASANGEQFDSAHNDAGKPQMSLKLETNGAAEGKTEQETPCSTSTIVQNLLEQSTQCNETQFSHVLPPSKKVKLADPASSQLCKDSSKGFLDAPITVSPLPLENMSTESPVKMPRVVSSPRTYGKRSRKTPTAGDPGVAQTESPLGENRTITPRVEKLLIRIKDRPENSTQHKSLVSPRQNLDMMTKREQPTELPLVSLLSTQTAKTAPNTNGSEDEKKVAIPIIVFALKAKSNEHPEKPRKAKGNEHPEKQRKKKSLNDLSGEKIMELIQQTPGASGKRRKWNKKTPGVGGQIRKLNQQTPGVSSQGKKRGRPPKLAVKMASGTGVDGGNNEVADKSVAAEKALVQVEVPIQKVEGADKETATELSVRDCLTNEIDISVPAVEDENQPLATLIEGNHSLAIIEDSRLSPGKLEKRKKDLELETVPSIEEASVFDGTPSGNQCLPFVKRSMVWKTIESMEVFRVVPQKPHFLPLADSKEEFREGLAIGAMVTFSTLFDKIASFKFDDSRSVLEGTLESLVDLEKHGFDVTMPRDRVNQLLSISDSREKLQSESKDVEKQIKELSDEREKLDESAKDIERKMAELREQLDATKLKLKNKDGEIAKLQSVVDSANVQIDGIRCKFEVAAGAPWKDL